MIELKLYLYCVGNTPASNKTINDLRTALDRNIESKYSIEIIDLLNNPEVALKDAVFITPTLIKVYPEPIKRIIGDLSDGQKVLRCLGIDNNHG